MLIFRPSIPVPEPPYNLRSATTEQSLAELLGLDPLTNVQIRAYSYHPGLEPIAFDQQLPMASHLIVWRTLHQGWSI